MKTLRINLLAHMIGSIYSSLFYHKPKSGRAETSKPKKFSFKWEGSYEASLTK